MYDRSLENGRDSRPLNGQIKLESFAPSNISDDPTDPQSAQTNGDETGAFADFVRKQPILTLSVAFGLGLLATSLLARRSS
jgi:hypothetical protein